MTLAFGERTERFPRDGTAAKSKLAIFKTCIKNAGLDLRLGLGNRVSSVVKVRVL